MKPEPSSQEQINAAASAWVARGDAGLTAAEKAELTAWTRQDQRHADALARFESLWNSVGRPRRVGDGTRLTRELAELKRRRNVRVIATTTSAALALLVFFWVSDPLKLRVASPPKSGIVILTPEKRTLPDGSVVELKSGTEIALDFTPELRRVRVVHGEAHFSVTKNPARPFVVSAGEVEVRAVGTAFAVQLADNSVGLLVTEGRVSVQQISAPPVSAAKGDGLAVPTPREAPRGFVDAGHRVEIDAVASRNAPLQINPVSADELSQRLSWRARRAEFSGTPLADVIALLNHYTHQHFVIQDAELARVPLSGLFPLEDEAAFARMLETGFSIRTEPHGADTWLVRDRR